MTRSSLPHAGKNPLLLLATLTIACSLSGSQPPVGLSHDLQHSEPTAVNVPCDPDAPSADQDTISYLCALAHRSGASTLLRSLVSTYRQRDYPPQDLASLLNSLASILTPLAETLQGPHRSHQVTLTLAVDPLCQKCKRVYLWLRTLQAADPELPPISVVPVATAEPESPKVVTALAMARTRGPDFYDVAITEFLNLAPGDSHRLADLLAFWTADNAPRHGQLPADFQSTAAAVEEAGLPLPVVLGNGCLIARPSGHTVPFDPFRDDLHFHVSLRLLGAVRSYPRPNRR